MVSNALKITGCLLLYFLFFLVLVKSRKKVPKVSCHRKKALCFRCAMNTKHTAPFEGSRTLRGASSQSPWIRRGVKGLTLDAPVEIKRAQYPVCTGSVCRDADTHQLEAKCTRCGELLHGLTAGGIFYLQCQQHRMPFNNMQKVKMWIDFAKILRVNWNYLK